MTIDTSVPRPRILIVAHGYPPNQTSGGEMRARRKAVWWSQHGFDVTVVAADPRSQMAAPVSDIQATCDTLDGIHIHRLAFEVPDAHASIDATYQRDDLATELRRIAQAVQPVVIYHISGYLFGVLPVTIARELGIPCILFAADFWHVCPRMTLLKPSGAVCTTALSHPADCAACRLSDRRWARLLGPRWNHLIWTSVAQSGRMTNRLPLTPVPGVHAYRRRADAVRQALRDYALVSVESEFLAAQMRMLGVENERLIVVRQGVDPAEIAPIGRKQDVSTHGLRVLFLGQIQPHKGVDILLEAVDIATDQGVEIDVRVHGPRGAAAGFDARIRVLERRTGVTVAPPLGRDELASAFGWADVLVVPSRWYDNSPNVILEAFACGVPVVVAGHGGMAEMVRDGVDGLHFAPGNARSLATALRRLIDEPALLPALRAGIIPPGDIDAEMAVEQAAIDRLLSTWRPGVAERSGPTAGRSPMAPPVPASTRHPAR